MKKLVIFLCRGKRIDDNISDIDERTHDTFNIDEGINDISDIRLRNENIPNMYIGLNESNGRYDLYEGDKYWCTEAYKNIGNSFRARVDEWFISKNSSASIVGAILACYVLSLSESYINSLNTDGNDKFRRRAIVALINNYKYEELFYYLRKPENRQLADSLLAYLKVTIY